MYGKSREILNAKLRTEGLSNPRLKSIENRQQKVVCRSVVVLLFLGKFQFK